MKPRCQRILRCLSCAPVAAFLLFCLFSCHKSSVVIQKSPGSTEAADQLRALYLKDDFRGGLRTGAALAVQFSRIPHVQAWYLLNMAGAGKPKEAVEAAKKLTEGFPRDPWSWFALAATLNWYDERGSEAPAASEKALMMMPNHPDFLWIRAEVLGDHVSLSDAISFVDQNLRKVKNPAELLVTRASFLRLEALHNSTDSKGMDLAPILADFEKARHHDPSNVHAYFRPGYYLSLDNDRSAAHPWLEKALAMAPDSYQIGLEYWRNVIAWLLEQADKHTPEETMLQVKVQEFVNSTSSQFPGLLGDAWQALLSSYRKDPRVPPEQLLRAARELVKSRTDLPWQAFSQAVTALAERKVSLPEAEALAREGLAKSEEAVRKLRPNYTSEWEYEREVKWVRSHMLQALGWVHFHEGRDDAARREFLHSLELNSRNLDAYHHLGQMYLAKGDIKKAESYYIQGMIHDPSEANPSAGPLHSIYQKRVDGEAKYPELMERVRQLAIQQKRRDIQSDRPALPEQIEPFELKTLEGQKVSSASLRGKVVVVHFWGLWCGACMEKMPNFIQFSEQHRDDKDLSILAINAHDNDLEKVKQWSTKNRAPFPILEGTNYTEKVKVNGFPATWFLDRKGRRVFQVGPGNELIREFNWRVEMLKTPESQWPKPAS